jgi:putative heme-binding domain-containing protein
VFNNIPIRHVVMEERYLNRNPYLAATETAINIAPPGDTGAVYALCPPVLLIPQPAEFFTSACGPTIYRGDLLGPQYRGNAFVCEAVHNLVTRRVLEPRGPTFVAQRAEREREFLASTDPWFHGVFTATGPDGALYIVDFYRQFVEHPHWVAESIRGKIAWRTGEEHGRIWRIRSKNAQLQIKHATPNLSQAGPGELVAHLADENGWWRDTAQRLLVERQDRSVAPALEKMAHQSSSPFARLHALHTLEGLGALRAETAIMALKDKHPRVREHAICLCEPFLKESTARASDGGAGMTRALIKAPINHREVGPALLSLVDDPDARVRYQLALTVGEWESSQKWKPLIRLTRSAVTDHWQSLAILSSVGETPLLFLTQLVQADSRWLESPAAEQAQFLAQLAKLVATRRQEPELKECFELLASSKDKQRAPGRLAILAGLADGLAGSETSLRKIMQTPPGFLKESAPKISPLFLMAVGTALSPRDNLVDRVNSIRVLSQADPELAGPVLLRLLKPEHPNEIQSAVARGLPELNDGELMATVVGNWSQYSQTARRQLLSAGLRSVAVTKALLNALEQGTISLVEVDAATRQAMQKIQNPEIKSRVQNLLQSALAPDRDEVVRRFQPSLQMAGDRRRGAALFAKTCVTCHAIQGQGKQVGPDLSGISSHSKETLLTDILDPSRQVLPDFVNYTLVTVEGETVTGFIVSETGSSVTLRRAGETDDTVLRSRIKELRADGKSLMPEGLEQGLAQQDMADLLEFLRQPDSKLLPAGIN